MLPHQPSDDLDLRKPGRGRTPRDTKSMDSEWLDEHARSYASRWETSEASVAVLLERKIRERCERTKESPEEALEMIPEVVARLVERNYVSDLRFAEGVLERQRRRGASTEQIRARLLDKGIASSLIASLFAAEKPDVESESAWRLAKRRRLGPYCSDPEKREQSRERHLAAFSRAGFDYEAALRVVDARSIPGSE